MHVLPPLVLPRACAKRPAWTIPFGTLWGQLSSSTSLKKERAPGPSAFQVLHSVAQSLREAQKFKTVAHPTNSHTPIRPRITLDVWCDTMAPIVELRSDRLVLDNGDVQAILSGQNPLELSLSNSGNAFSSIRDPRCSTRSHALRFSGGSTQPIRSFSKGLATSH